MSIYDYIDNMIMRLNGVEVSGVANMEAIVEVVKALGELKKAIKVEGADDDADAENKQG